MALNDFIYNIMLLIFLPKISHLSLRNFDLIFNFILLQLLESFCQSKRNFNMHKKNTNRLYFKITDTKQPKKYPNPFNGK